MRRHWRLIVIAAIVTVASIAFGAWYFRTRVTYLMAMDVLSGNAIPLGTDSFHIDLKYVDPDNPFLNFSCSAPQTQDGGLNRMIWIVNWNMPIKVIISPNGFAKAEVIINDESPEVITVLLHRKPRDLKK